jgi:RecA-family ATPase
VTDIDPGDPEFFRKLASREVHNEGHNAADGAAKQQQNGATTEAPCLTVAAWLARDIPPPDFLMGEWVSTTSRVMIVSATGLGKTNLCLALAFAIALGHDFLHWRAGRKARVLYIDGEMSRRLVKTRLTDAARRAGAVPGTLFILCADDVQNMEPLNKPVGQQFIDTMIEQLGGIDFVILDNIQSLLLGDMKDEEPWQDTLLWVRSLTNRAIGQLWVHHTGHDDGRSYGTKTREWQLDTVILLKRIENTSADIGFTLEFTKSRERAPHNRANFETVNITLADDRWEVQGAGRKSVAKPPSPLAQKFHAALLDALASKGMPRPQSASRPSVTMKEWKAESCRLGVLDLEPDDRRRRNSQAALFSNNRANLVAAGWIACNGDFAWNMKLP